MEIKDIITKSKKRKLNSPSKVTPVKKKIQRYDDSDASFSDEYAQKDYNSEEDKNKPNNSKMSKSKNKENKLK
jgi:hypothetical protein